MKHFTVTLFCVILLLSLSGCGKQNDTPQIAATTLPVYEFTLRLCEGTDITVSRLVSEEVSCLHDYTLQVSQMRAVEQSRAVVISGAGLEAFLDGVLDRANATIDASAGIELHCGDHIHDHAQEHSQEEDPHIWLSPANATIMVQNICSGLVELYPENAKTFQSNLIGLLADLDALQAYADEKLSTLSCRKLITFHDGFAYFAESFDLHIIKAVEEESGSEASALELIELIELVKEHDLPAVFTEANGADAAASIISAEAGVPVFVLDMAMGGDSYFSAMYRNIDTIWEAMQ